MVKNYHFFQINPRIVLNIGVFFKSWVPFSVDTEKCQKSLSFHVLDIGLADKKTHFELKISEKLDGGSIQKFMNPFMEIIFRPY